MNTRIALAISVGVLLAVWVKVAALGGMPWFIGAIGWACYSAAGGRVQGLTRAIAGGVAGMVWVAIAEMVVALTQHPDLEWIVLGIALIILIVEGKVPLLSFVPAALCGAAVIGAGGPIGILDLIANLKLGFAFVIGAVIGAIADQAAGLMARKA